MKERVESEEGRGFSFLGIGRDRFLSSIAVERVLDHQADDRALHGNYFCSDTRVERDRATQKKHKNGVKIPSRRGKPHRREISNDT